MSELVLPDEVEISHELGFGRRSNVYLAKHEGRDVVIKVYKQTYIDKYQNQYKVNIGEFEFQRNKAAYDDEILNQYIAQPYSLLKPSDGYSLALIQEYVSGEWLTDYIERTKFLPEEVLQAGYLIVKEAARLGMYDLDISLGNIRIQQNVSGKWHPKLYDFNLMPQHIKPPNPFMALGFLLKLRSKNHRDYRSLQHWQDYADKMSK
ncbi:MAG: hypothetical protein AAGB35_02200 [Pseudomonadota bacterium]